MKRFLCAVLSLCLLGGLLSGCQSGGDDEGQKNKVPMGRYIEDQLGTLAGVERVRGVYRNEEGALVGFGMSRTEQWVKRFVVSADGQVQEENIHWLTELMAAGGNITGIMEGKDGSVYAIYSDVGGSFHFVRAAGGEPQSISIPEWEKETEEPGPSGNGSISFGESGSVSVGSEAASADAVSIGGDGSITFGNTLAKPSTGFYLLEGGDYLILYGPQGASRYSGEDGTLLREYPCSAYYNTTAVHGNKLLAFSPDYSALWLYDLDTGTQSECAFEGLDYSTLPNLDETGFYLTNSGGIFRQGAGGTLWEKLVDGELTSLSMPDLSLGAVVSEPDGSFWVLLSGETDMEIMRYTYSADTPTNPDTELTIASLKDNSTIRQAIGEFQRRNSNVKVNFQVLLDEESAATAEDVIRALNTELLNGKGPDLLVLDGLPGDSYIEKGVLEDLSALVEKLEGQGLMSNLMGAYRANGGVYALPCRFTLPVMMGQKTDVEQVRSLSDLAGLVEERQGDEIPFLRSPDSLWGEEGIAPAYVQLFAPARQGAGVDEAALTTFYRELQRINETLKANTPEMGGTSAIITMVSSSGGGAAEVMDMGPYDLKNGRGAFHIQELGGIHGLNLISDNLEREKGWALDSLFGAGEFKPKGAVGVVTTSGQKELAQAFLELLLSPTVQDKYLGDGFPVDRTSLKKSVEGVLEGGDDMGFLALSETLNTPVLTDQVVTDVVLQQAKNLLDGSLTPEEAAAQVVEKTQIYLSE